MIEGNQRKPLYRENSSRDRNGLVTVGGGFLFLTEGSIVTGPQTGAGSAAMGEERQELKHRGTTRLIISHCLVDHGRNFTPLTNGKHLEFGRFSSPNFSVTATSTNH